MLFPTVEYAIFFIVTLAIGWALVDHHRVHKLFLLGASWFFYAFWDWRFLPMLVALSGFAWVMANGIKASTGRKHQVWLTAGIIGCFAPLVYFKYASFLLLTLANVLAACGIPFGISPPSVYLPLGISFMVFHAISLLMDVHRGKLAEVGPLEDTLLYVSFFPQVIAGPILRAHSFIPQLRKAPDPTRVMISRSLLLIVLGLFKKVVLANVLGTGIVDEVFNSPASFSAAKTLVGVYAYAVQIYCDFSGYTDIASGCALLMGYRFPANFANPYAAMDPQDFWRRWHISLSTWLRDYLYIPLGGSRGGQARTSINLMITMLLGGLWHGASWTFVLWGALHGSLLVGHRVWTAIPFVRDAGAWRKSAAWAWASRILLFNAVCAGWILFRAQDFPTTWAVFRSIGHGTWDLGGITYPTIAAITIGMAMQYVPLRAMAKTEFALSAMPPLLRGGLASIAIMVVEILGPTGVAPFIYFQF
jgi:D-alanyl-lipoteichoic acid acyltransferase DltB (MBOAT superfamily)